jgi:hypothetical protein
MDLFVYLACVIAIAALACGHQGEDFPIRLGGAWRYLTAARTGGRGFRDDGAPERAAEARVAHSRPSWAQPDKDAA